jgi:hypothetical protein
VPSLIYSYRLFIQDIFSVTCSNKLKKSNEPFPDLLNKYASYLDDICGHLLNTCRHAVHRRQKLIWMKPVPPRFDLTPEQNDQFQQITKMSDDISQRYGFKPFDRYFIWERSRQELLMHNSHHFGCKGKQKKILISS